MIDEAHNLAGRAREMYSASIIKERFSGDKKADKGDLTPADTLSEPGQPAASGDEAGM